MLGDPQGFDHHLDKRGPKKSIREYVGAFLLSSLLTSSLAFAHYVPSPAFPTFPNCLTVLGQGEGILNPYVVSRGADKLYQSSEQRFWEIDDYGGIFRYSRLTQSEADHLIVEEYNPMLGVGPSKQWIQTLQALGQMPRDLNLLKTGPELLWADIDRFIDINSLHQSTHPYRENYLNANRTDYVNRLLPGFQFALSQYPRRAWFTPEFEKGAVETFNKTLKTASYVFLRDRATGEIVVSIRLVRVHNGLLRLKHVKSGRTLEITGNAEITWGSDGTFKANWPGLVTTFQVERFLREFALSSESTVKRTSDFESLDLVRLPMEQGMGIELPRNYEFMPLEGQPGIEKGNQVSINGERYEVSFGHAVLVEPGLFAIKKSSSRPAHFLELAIWLGKYLTQPRLPAWVKEKNIGYWTYNDLPLYKIFGFEKDENYPPFHKYGVDWDVYGASVDDILKALGQLTDRRSDHSDRSQRLNQYLKDMESGGF